MLLCTFVCRFLDAPKSKCSFCTFCVSAQDGIPYDLNKQRLLLIDTAAFSTKYAPRSVGGAVCVRLYKRKKIKQVTCKTRTQLTSTDHCLTPQNRVVGHPDSVCTKSINTPFPINCILVKYALQYVGAAVCMRLYNRKKIKQVTCTARKQFISTNHCLTPRIDVLEHANSVFTKSINTPSLYIA